jgi:hypothetical protein
MYKESNLSDKINNMWIDKSTKKVIYLINSQQVDRQSTKKVIYLTILTICG